MLRKVRRFIYTAAAALSLAMPALVPVAVHAQINTAGGAACGIEGQVNSSGAPCPVQAADANLTTLVQRIINVLSVIIGVIAVVMIIIGGLRYITSGGDSGNVSSAKNTILYAIVGLIVVALAQFIVRFVLSNASGI